MQMDSKSRKLFLTLLLSLASLAASGCSLINCFQTQPGPSEATFSTGQLAPCEDRPNCVSTQSASKTHAIVPFTYSKSLQDAMNSLRQEVLKMPRSSLVKIEGAYMHFEFRSRVIQAIDDVEFYFDDQTKTVQFRSATRLGHSDWGENRKRMEQIRNVILGRI